MPSPGYLERRKNEQNKVIETTFWQDLIKEIHKQRRNAVDRCVKNENINRIQFHQGEVNSIDRVLDLPDKLYKEKEGQPLDVEPLL